MNEPVVVLFKDCIYSPKQNGCIYLTQDNWKDNATNKDSKFLYGRPYTNNRSGELDTFKYCSAGLDKANFDPNRNLVDVEISTINNGGGQFFLQGRGNTRIQTTADYETGHGFTTSIIPPVLTTMMKITEVAIPFWIKITPVQKTKKIRKRVSK